MYALYAILMAATTLRIDTRQKTRFDKLQAKLRAITGRKITQAELLDRILDQVEANPEALVGRAWRPLTKAEIRRVMELPMDLGFELGDVDEVLYGKKRRTSP